MTVDPELPERTRPVYERHAHAWDRHRPRKLFERPWLERALPRDLGGTVLDVGCGAGDPIARFFIEQGYALHGVDFAEAMIAICRERFPEQTWSCADMRTLELGTTFSSVIAWDSFFHLTMDEQRTCLPRLARHVAPGGWLLFTCGPREGEVTGTVEGDAVYHASLDPNEYAARLEEAQMQVEAFVPEDPDCDFHTICLARRPR